MYLTCQDHFVMITKKKMGIPLKGCFGKELQWRFPIERIRFKTQTWYHPLMGIIIHQTSSYVLLLLFFSC